MVTPSHLVYVHHEYEASLFVSGEFETGLSISRTAVETRFALAVLIVVTVVCV